MDQVLRTAAAHACGDIWGCFLRSLNMCYNMADVLGPVEPAELRRNVSYVRRGTGCSVLDGWCDTMSMRCRSDGEPIIFIAPSTVGFETSSEWELDAIQTVIDPYLSGCDRAENLWTDKFGKGRTDRMFVCPWLFWWRRGLRLGGHFSALLSPSCSHARHSQSSNREPWFRVGFHLCLWWRVMIARRWLGGLLRHSGWRQGQIPEAEAPAG